MTAAFDNRQDAGAAAPPSLRARMAAIGGWLAAQWPKAAIAFGFALTIAWTALLGWGLSFALYLF
jgi:hypothetical protein